VRRKKNPRNATEPKQEPDNHAEKNNADNSSLPPTEDKGPISADMHQGDRGTFLTALKEVRFSLIKFYRGEKK
jgi:hypothetical protein